MISLVAAIGKNGEIGANNKLLWSLPNDMKYFKELTTGGTVLMGRKTYQSIGKPLPNRKNFVLTRELNTIKWDDGAIPLTPSYTGGVIKMWSATKEELFVIGGQQVYEKFLPYADRLYITSVDGEFPEADKFFPDFDMNEWEISSTRFSYPDKKNKYKQVYIVLDKCKIK